MRKFKKEPALTVLAAAFLVLGIISPNISFGATTPSLGLSASYGVLAGTYTNTSAATTINGDVGYTTGPVTPPIVSGTIYGAGAPTPTAQTDTSTLLGSLAANACTFTFAPGAIDLGTDATHGTIGVYNPGVYCSSGAMNIGSPITLSGSGTYIFRPVGALTSTVGTTVTLTGPSACDVFWTPTAATTLAATTTFSGTIVDNANAITIGANTTVTGRLLSIGAGVITTGDTSTVTVPTCTNASFHIIKTVVNTGGGLLASSDFNLYVKTGGVNVSGSPAVGVISPGTLYSLSGGTYEVSEDVNNSYTKTFSGDCDSAGSITFATGAEKICTIINTYIIPVVQSGGSIPVYILQAMSDAARLLENNTLPVVISNPVITAISNPPVNTVFVPAMPNTGYPTQSKNYISYAIIFLGIIGASLFIYFHRKAVNNK